MDFFEGAKLQLPWFIIKSYETFPPQISVININIQSEYNISSIFIDPNLWIKKKQFVLNFQNKILEIYF
jgi:hypothetical protein